MSKRTELVDAICRRMEAKPYTSDATDSYADIERLVPKFKERCTILSRIEECERTIRERDDSDVFHIG